MKIEHIALYVKDLETARDFLWKKPLAAAISPGRALEDISGENQDAASFNRFAAAFVYCLHGGSLPPPDPMHLLLLLLFAGSYTRLMALVGLFFGIKMPTLTWTGEIMPIKQGASVMITLLCSLGYIVLLFVGFMLLPGWMLGFGRYMSCFAAANLFLSVLAYLWLRKKGVACFLAL